MVLPKVKSGRKKEWAISQSLPKATIAASIPSNPTHNS
jgi:hypothetical protein